MKFLSVRSKIFILVFIILIPLITLQYHHINRAFNQKVNSELKACEDFAEAISTGFTNYIDEIWIQEKVIGTYFAMNQNLPNKERNEYLTEVLKREENLLGVSFIDTKGIVIGASNPKLVGKDLSKFQLYKKILSGEEKAISNLEKSITSGEPSLWIGRAIKVNGKLIGIIGASIDVNKLSFRLPESKANMNSNFGIVDGNGLVVYRSDKTKIPFEERRLSEGSPSRRALKGEVVRTVSRDSKFDISKQMGVDLPIKALGWECFVITSYESAMAQHKKNTLYDISILSILSLVSVTAAFFLSGVILKPIEKLKETANCILKGDLTARANVIGNDEIAATAKAFDHMAAGIEQNDKVKTQFFSNISHELKTPVNVIFAATQLICTEQSNNDDREFRGIVKKNLIPIKQNCYRLMKLIGNLIDITKYDSGFLKIKMGNYNIVGIVEDITMSVVKYAASKKITLIFDTDVEEKIIACDPDMIERIILNIISNSLKFTDENGTILVSIFLKEEKVIISVKDTGIGIPEDKLKYIFCRFAQVDSSLNRNQEGSGIGLSLVKSLVEAQNGTIYAKSKLGCGTEIIIEFPFTQSKEIQLSEKLDIRNNCANSIVERINVEFSDIYSIYNNDIN